MIQLLLTLFIVLFAPIPWIIITIHILIISGRWNSIISKMSLAATSLVVWISVGYWLLNENEFLFANRVDSITLQIIGIIVLLTAMAIEFFTHKALTTKKIFGSDEFRQRKGKLVTHGIYKYARHPRYVEHPLWALGLGLTFGYPILLLFFIYLLVGFTLVAYFEEQELIKRYGEEYLRYKKKTPAFFIWIKN